MFLVADALPGRLWIMPCPASDRLQDTVAMWKEHGVNRVVSLLPSDEMAELGVSSEPALCKAAQIAFTSHPITDFGLPEPRAFATLIQGVGQDIRAGHGVAIHCRAGIGRSGMAVAGTLMALGRGVEEAVDHVTRIRGVSIPDTIEQLQFLRDFVSKLN